MSTETINGGSVETHKEPPTVEALCSELYKWAKFCVKRKASMVAVRGALLWASDMMAEEFRVETENNIREAIRLEKGGEA